MRQGLAGHTVADWVLSVAFSPDGQHIVWKSGQLGEGVVVNGILLSYYISHNFSFCKHKDNIIQFESDNFERNSVDQLPVYLK